jgi:hypothetical protein
MLALCYSEARSVPPHDSADSFTCRLASRTERGCSGGLCRFCNGHRTFTAPAVVAMHDLLCVRLHGNGDVHERSWC